MIAHTNCSFTATLPFRSAVGDDGHSALHWAALKGNLRAMLSLLRAGARVDAQDNWRFTPLIRAAQNGHLLAVLLLLQVRRAVSWRLRLSGLGRSWMGAGQIFLPPELVSTFYAILGRCGSSL
jgi:ankyrin repeat protein